jgi:hypothetical protein
MDLSVVRLLLMLFLFSFSFVALFLKSLEYFVKFERMTFVSVKVVGFGHHHHHHPLVMASNRPVASFVNT